MKIQFDKKDINYINNINDNLKNGEDIPLFINEVGRKYYLEFTCTDIALANCFIMNLFDPNLNKKLKENFGLELEMLRYHNGDSKIEELKEKLQLFINELDNL